MDYLHFKHSFPRGSLKNIIGRSPDLRINGWLSLPMLKTQWIFANLPSRLQWRDRVGFTPTSLLVSNDRTLII
jgi:hypothetical protein